MKLKAVQKHPLLHLAAFSLLATQAIPNIALAQAQPAPPLSGVLGKVQSFTGSSLDVATASGVVHVTVAQPFATYKQIPSDLSHVTSNSYVGVASVEQADGTELAKQVIIFPKELRGAAEGSVLLAAVPQDAGVDAIVASFPYGSTPPASDCGFPARVFP
jgi:hypothetical protein